MLNVISIKNGKSYFICNDINYQKILENVFGVKFKNDIAVIEKALLRKEIIKLAKMKNYWTFLSYLLGRLLRLPLSFFRSRL